MSRQLPRRVGSNAAPEVLAGSCLLEVSESPSVGCHHKDRFKPEKLQNYFGVTNDDRSVPREMDFRSRLSCTSLFAVSWVSVLGSSQWLVSLPLSLLHTVTLEGHQKQQRPKLGRDTHWFSHNTMIFYQISSSSQDHLLMGMTGKRLRLPAASPCSRSTPLPHRETSAAQPRTSL